jgi:hypothetical protein
LKTICVLVGGFAGYMLTMFLCCFVLYPESNLCGLPAVFIGGPAGLVIGWLFGSRLTRVPPDENDS